MHGFNLKEQPTRKLLYWLQRARECGGYGYDPSENGNSVITVTELKVELATREHIPSKTEGKRLRREAAKRGR